VPRTLLIVDDHVGFRQMARRLLEASGFDVVGEACDGLTAVEAASRLRPRVVLVDVQLPDLDGFEVAVRLARLEPAPAVVLTSSRDAVSLRRRLESSPVRGFIPKDELTGAVLAKLVA
jgi:DNA-binding NarL/FixJ family response regulator